MLRTPKLFVLLMLLVPLPLLISAAPQFTYNGLETYTVTVEKVQPAHCAPEHFNRDNSEGGKRESKFHRAVCIFHNSARPEDNDIALSLFQENQRQGLPPVKQNFSALLEGLLHCRQADFYFKRYRASAARSATSPLAAKKNLLEKTRFCRERRLAMASFSDVNWEHAYFDYEAVAAANFSLPFFTLKDRIKEMGACYGGVLSTDLNPECGLISNMTETEIENTSSSAVASVLKNYFEGAESPITAMFSRKVERAQGLLSSANARITKISNKAAPLNNQYSALYNVYSTIRDKKLDKITGDYRNSVLLSNTILDEFERWKGGLFITSEGTNLLRKIIERDNPELEGELKRITGKSILPKLQQLLSEIKVLSNQEEAYGKQVKQLCQIYFCELLKKKNLPTIINFCRKTSMKKNPLCIGLEGDSFRDGIITINFNGSDHKSSVLELCSRAGLTAAYAKIGLDREESTKCLKQLN
ncbi:MAG: hypothetical protein HQK50_08700 [Oligoflexia bacterium]|nr:hypothetical protein [Oligoflexia bacterium]MBF0365637.1 hypothetical protein [Oligoflexia bacterium]